MTQNKRLIVFIFVSSRFIVYHYIGKISPEDTQNISMIFADIGFPDVGFSDIGKSNAIK